MMKKCFNIKFLVVASLTVGWLMLFPKPATAQSALELTISPPVEYLQIKPGEKKAHTVILQNSGSVPLSITSQVVDFTADGLTGQPQLQQHSSFSFLTQTDPNPGQFPSIVLEPGRKQNFTFTIDVPSSTSEKEYALTLLFSARATQDFSSNGVGSQVAGTIGSNLIVLVSQSNKNRGQINLKEIQAPLFVDSFSSLDFSILLENSGHNATTASGSATITDLRNKTVAAFTFFPDMILAKTTRQARASQPNPDQPTQSEPQPFKYDPLFLFGPYTVTVTIPAETANQTNSTSTTTNASKSDQTYSTQIFAVPFSFIGLGILGIALYWVSFWFNQKLKNDDQSNKKSNE